MRLTKAFGVGCIAMASCLGDASFAQTAGPVQAPTSSLSNSAVVLAFPGGFGVPTAVAPRSGTGFAGVTYGNPRGGVSGAGGDGDIVAGYSLGNPINGVSFTLGLAITGTEPLGDAGSFSLSASRLLRAGGKSATFIGVSASNLAPWGVDARRPAMFSAYVSHLVGITVGQIEIPVQVTVGYGTDNTRQSNGSGALEDGAFAGIGVGVSKIASLGISATRTQLNLGATLTVPNVPVSVTFGMMDVTNNTNRRQFSLSVGLAF